MASFLPGASPAFDRSNMSSTVKQLCSYTRNLQETLDFMLGQFEKELSGQKTRYDSLEARISALEKRAGV